MTLGNNKTLSKIALGTAMFGGCVSESDAFELIDLYRDRGGNILDTARVYGESESVIGRYLAACGGRRDLIISTKGGHYDLSNGRKRINAREISDDLDESLRNLKTDHVDIYWLHRDDEDVPAGEIMEMLAPHVRSGKILSVGVSNWSVDRIAEANIYAQRSGLPQISASQIKHCAAVTVSELDPTIRSLDEDSRPFYERTKMPIFAFTSQAKGLFSKLDSGIALSRALECEFLCDQNLSRYKKIKELSDDLCRPISQIALSLLTSDLSLDVIPIIGGRTKEQIADSMASIDIKLTREQIETITKG